MNRNRYPTFAMALLLAALVVFARCGHTLQAAAPPRGVLIEPKSFPARDDEDDGPRRLKRDEDLSDLEGDDRGSSDGDDPTTIAGGLTAPTTAGTTTTSTHATTNTEQSRQLPQRLASIRRRCIPRFVTPKITTCSMTDYAFLAGFSSENRLGQGRRRSSRLRDQPEKTE